MVPGKELRQIKYKFVSEFSVKRKVRPSTATTS
jgi:hypothetical protein